jgi:hypothetical protein
MRLSAALLTVRGLPGIIRHRRLPRWGLDRPFWAQLVRTPGFLTLVGPHDRYAAFGYVGRPWKPAAEACELTAEEFADFDAPGWAKVVMDLSATASRGSTLLRTETRIHLTDEHARRAFGRYWAVVRYGSNALRWDWLRAARRRARGAA